MSLPIETVLPELIDTLRGSRIAVLTAPPGAGKSTVVPLALEAAGLLEGGALWMLEPRRIAARMCAARMAERLGERVGETVGYRVRFDAACSAKTRIVVVTEGILSRRLVSDPFLEGVSCVILDEFHERSVHADLSLAFLRELLEVRDDLRLLVMSATIDCERIRRYLFNCRVVICEAAPHPLSVGYDAGQAGELTERAARGVRQMLREAPDQGDVLVFMPGAPEIERLIDRLAQDPAAGDTEVVPLYGALPPAAQDRALAPGHRRRVVVATNIAETSLTIPRVRAVVDSGLKKEIRFDPGLGLDRLETCAISRDGATQRAGRAARLGPGRVLRLWSRHEEQGRAARDVPEIQRVDAAPVILQLLAYAPRDPAGLSLLDPLPPERLAQGMALLEGLGLVAPGGFALTEVGAVVARMPVHPRLGAILQAACAAGAPALGAAAAALAAEQDILGRDGGLEGDFDHRVALLQQLEQEGGTRDAARRLGVHHRRAGYALASKQQLLGQAASLPAPPAPAPAPSVGSLLAAGFPDRVFLLRPGSAGEGVMVGGRGVRLVSSSPPGERAGLWVAVRIDAGRRGPGARARVFQMSPVSEAALAARFPERFSEQLTVSLDRDTGLVSARTARLFADLAISDRPSPNPDPARVAQALASACAAAWRRCFKPDAATAGLIARLRFAQRIMPDLLLPDLSEAGLKALLPGICAGKRSFEEVARADWRGAIAGLLGFQTRRRLDALFPETWTAPAGNRVPIDYGPAAVDPAATPVAACRLQALFGLTETPRIAGGRVPLTLHILAPNGRPCQVTADLESFWRHTYAAVRKDLRGRYPKHYWPEDPFTATPTRRVRPKG